MSLRHLFQKKQTGNNSKTNEQNANGSSDFKFSEMKQFKGNRPYNQAQGLVVDTSNKEIFTTKSFDDLKIDHRIAATLQTRLNVTVATHIQAAALPAMLEKRDVLIRAETGSGKTLAYCVPILQQLSSIKPPIKRSDGAYAIIIAPTRELALQIFENARKLFMAYINIVPGVIIGGQKKKSEKASLRKGINFLISTPGRLQDHLATTTSFDVSNLKWLVLDEADRLLDMGFEKKIADILQVINERKKNKNDWNTALVSATLSSEVHRLATMSLKNPIYVDAALKQKKRPEQKKDSIVKTEKKGENSTKEKGKLPKTIEQKQDAEGKKLEKEEKRQENEKKEMIKDEREGNKQKEQTKKVNEKKAKDNDQIANEYKESTDQMEVEETQQGDKEDEKEEETNDSQKSVTKADDTTKEVKEENEEESDNEQEFTSSSLPAPTESFDFPKGLQQKYIICETKDRLSLLAAFLRNQILTNPSKIIVFMNSISSVEFHYALFSRAKWIVDSTKPPLFDTSLFRLHGQLSQIEREKVFTKFRSISANEPAIIFCTDVASRGVDVAGVSTIVQYDPPDEPAEYVHRVGRTARMGNSGLAVLFLLQSEEKYIELLKEKYNVTATEEKLPPLMRKLFPGKNSEDQAHHLALHFEHIVMDNDEIHDLARNGYNAFLRSYSIHSAETKKIFAIKSLHLGHVANSFALRESPKEIKEYFIKQRKAESLVKQKLKRKEEQAQKQGTAAFERRQLFSKATGESALASEFAAALTTKTTKKAKHSPMPGWKRKRAGGKGGKNKRQKQ